MTHASELDSLAKEHFVSLSTFRKTGEAVSTPVWIARDGDALVVTTPAGSGKVKRLRNSPRVELRACDRRGRVKDGAASVSAVAEILAEPGVVEREAANFLRKYKMEFRIVMFIERVAKKGPADRVILRITAQ